MQVVVHKNYFKLHLVPECTIKSDNMILSLVNVCQAYVTAIILDVHKWYICNHYSGFTEGIFECINVMHDLDID